MARNRTLGEQFDGVLTAARLGRGWAFEALWRSLAPQVTGYVRAQGAPHPEDVASEVFIGVFRSLDGFSGDEDAFRRWVFTIAHRRLVDERRSRARRVQTVSSAEVVQDTASPDGGPEEEVLARLATERVRAVCVRLAPDQRDVLLLRLIASMTVEEVAVALGKSPGAVKALQRRGLVAVRKALEDQGVPLRATGAMT